MIVSEGRICIRMRGAYGFPLVVCGAEAVIARTVCFGGKWDLYCVSGPVGIFDEDGCEVNLTSSNFSPKICTVMKGVQLLRISGANSGFNATTSGWNSLSHHI